MPPEKARDDNQRDGDCQEHKNEEASKTGQDKFRTYDRANMEK
jgi:hypothetical protein